MLTHLRKLCYKRSHHKQSVKRISMIRRRLNALTGVSAIFALSFSTRRSGQRDLFPDNPLYPLAQCAASILLPIPRLLPSCVISRQS